MGEGKYSRWIVNCSVGVCFERYDGLKWKSSQLYRDGEYNRSMNICTVFSFISTGFCFILESSGASISLLVTSCCRVESW